MAVAIGGALHCPPLVLFSLVAVGYSANALGGAGGPLSVLVIAIVAAITGPIATCIFGLQMNGPAISSGMGTCGLGRPDRGLHRLGLGRRQRRERGDHRL